MQIVMIPFMGQGHLIPALALALKLEKEKGCSITIVNTPHNIRNLRLSLPATSSVRLVELPFNGSDHGLPPDSENTDSIPTHLIFPLHKAFFSLKPSFANLLSDLVNKEGSSCVCVISDMFFPWSAEAAHDLGLFHVLFSPSGAFGLAGYYSMWMHLVRPDLDSPDFTFPDFPEAGDFHISQLPPAFLEADNPRFAFMRMLFLRWSESDGFLFNTAGEIDRIGLDYFRRTLGRPAWPIGPIVLSLDGGTRGGKKAGMTTEQCVEWLDRKEDASVLYISFGSHNRISASQMMQLARALDKSERNFIWVVRPPVGFDPNAEFKAEEWLPEGFIERVEEKGRGLVIDRWAPQVEILSHRSTSAFMSHCGWNSLLEALSRGVPLICWPIRAEQFFNAKQMVEFEGVGVEVARGADLDVRVEDLLEKIEMVMGDNAKGREMRRRAIQVRDIINDAIRDEGDGYKGSSVKAMDEFLGAALSFKGNNTNTQSD